MANKTLAFEIGTEELPAFDLHNATVKLPGIAAAESINHNHNMALTDEVGGGVNPDTSIMRHEGNRVSEDMCDVAALFRPDFLVNVIVDAGGNFYKIVAGDWYKAWYQGTKDVMKLQGVATKQKSDVVIVSGGGYPHDISLYQGMKCYAPGAAATGPSGCLFPLRITSL